MKALLNALDVFFLEMTAWLRPRAIELAKQIAVVVVFAFAACVGAIFGAVALISWGAFFLISASIFTYPLLDISLPALMDWADRHHLVRVLMFLGGAAGAVISMVAIYVDANRDDTEEGKR